MLRKVVIVMSVFLKILLVVVIIFVLAVAGGIFYLTRGLGEGAKLVINSVDPAGLPDGEYNGSYKGGRWTNEMKVTVRDQKITQIEVVKDVAIAKPEVTQDVITKVINKQNVDIDAVSGATVTTKAYLKSIENALSKAE